VLVVIVAGVGVLAAKVADLAASYPTPRVTLSRTPFPSSTEPQLPGEPTARPLGTPTPYAVPATLRTAEERLEEWDASAALELLLPLLDQLSSVEDLTRLNTDLARAELILGHFQRAAGYYEAAFALGPTPELLLEVANAYDLGGDLHSALGRYLRLASWESAAEDLRQIARDRARDIVGVLGTPTPGP
jgi:tetratricopeptide (TPR) repeat protein